MQERLKTCKWRIAVWLLVVCCVQPTRAVSYKPTIANPRVYSSPISVSTDQMADAPEYQFQSTSIFVSTTGTPKIDFVPLADGARPLYTRPGARKEGLGEPEGDPVGQVTEPPVGEPLVLLLFALAYLVIKRRERRIKISGDPNKG